MAHGKVKRPVKARMKKDKVTQRSGEDLRKSGLKPHTARRRRRAGAR